MCIFTFTRKKKSGVILPYEGRIHTGNLCAFQKAYLTKKQPYLLAGGALFDALSADFPRDWPGIPSKCSV